MLQRNVKFPKTALAAAALLSYCVFPFNVKRMNSRLPVKTNNLQQTSLFFPSTEVTAEMTGETGHTNRNQWKTPQPFTSLQSG